MKRNLIGGLLLALLYAVTVSASTDKIVQICELNSCRVNSGNGIEVGQPYDLLPPDSISITLMRERISQEGKVVTAYFPPLDLAKNLEYSMPWAMKYDHDPLHAHVPPMIRIGQPYQEGIVTIFLREFDGFVSWRIERWVRNEIGLFTVFTWRFSPHGVWHSVYQVETNGAKLEEIELPELVGSGSPLWQTAVDYSKLAWQILGQTYPIHNTAP